MSHARRFRILLWTLLAACSLASAGDTDPAVAELLEQERLRAAIDATYEEYFRPASTGAGREDQAIQAAESFRRLGPAAVPYLVNEFEQERQETYDLCAYSLGVIGTPEATDALRVAIQRADDQATDKAASVKAWAAWGLGLAGDVQAITLITSGRHRVAWYPMHKKTSLLEAIALQTAPDSVPPLLELLETQVADPEKWQARRYTLRALRRVGDPTTAPALVALLEHSDPNVRREAVNALRGVDSPVGKRGLLEALGDEEVGVRRLAALALEELGPSGHRERLLERLEVETDPRTRGELYILLAEAAGDDAYDLLAGIARPADDGERRRLVKALGSIDDERRFGPLGVALGDEDNGVALESASILGRVGGPVAVELLGSAVKTRRPIVAQKAAEQLATLGASASAAIVARRLTGDLLAKDVDDTTLYTPVQLMARALLGLDDPTVIDGLREALERQSDPNVRGFLEPVIGGLEVSRRNGRKVARWVETSAAEDPETRHLAYRRLGRIGTSAAGRALVDAFESAGGEDRIVLLDALAGVPEPTARPLLERVLLEPEFDDALERPLRATAAWSARRLGGAALTSALRRSAERRRGQDARVLIYAALADPGGAVELLRSLRRPRMRLLGFTRGTEQDRLDDLARRIAAGRSGAALDLPPRKLRLD